MAHEPRDLQQQQRKQRQQHSRGSSVQCTSCLRGSCSSQAVPLACSSAAAPAHTKPSAAARLTSHADTAPVHCIRQVVLRHAVRHEGSQQRRRGAGGLWQQQGHGCDRRCDGGQGKRCVWETKAATCRLLCRCFAFTAAGSWIEGCRFSLLLVLQLLRGLQWPARQ